MVEAHCARDPRITAVLRYVTDAELVDEVGRAELVILPYHEMHNSGAILVAMSLGRPVLAPRTREQLGIVRRGRPRLDHRVRRRADPRVILSALDEVAHAASDRPSPTSSERDWDHVGRIIEGAYRQAIAQVRRRR